MDANKTELHAAETLLQRGVKVKARAPLLLRLFGKKTITLTLRVPTGGSLFRMGIWFFKCNLSAEQLEKIAVEDALYFRIKHGKNIYKALACLFIGNKLLTAIFLKPYSSWLMECLTDKEALMLLNTVILHGGLKDFMDTTRSLKKMTITEPRLGH